MLHLCQGPTPAVKQGHLEVENKRFGGMQGSHQDKHEALGPEWGPAEEEGRHNNNRNGGYFVKWQWYWSGSMIDGQCFQREITLGEVSWSNYQINI